MWEAARIDETFPTAYNGSECITRGLSGRLRYSTYSTRSLLDYFRIAEKRVLELERQEKALDDGVEKADPQHNTVPLPVHAKPASVLSKRVSCMSIPATLTLYIKQGWATLAVTYILIVLNPSEPDDQMKTTTRSSKAGGKVIKAVVTSPPGE